MTRLLPLLMANSGMGRSDVMRIIATAPRRYKTYSIKKRSGGLREISQPAREVKLFQRILIDSLLAQLPVHNCATAYKPGASIRDNATPHAGGNPILKMDFQDFFPSIRARDWIRYCQNNIEISDDDIIISTQLLFRRAKKEKSLKLSIGAPSSPMLSNILLFEFDKAVFDIAKEKGISYTRYADDMTFSGQRIGMLKDMLKIVEDCARKPNVPRLKVNHEKTTFVTSAVRRTVTGVTLSNDGQVGLGHEKKRLISATVHRAIQGKLSSEDLQKLVGQLAFANAVEPEFVGRLRKKYGTESITAIQKKSAATPFVPSTET